MARQIGTVIFGEAPTLRRRELISAVAHYVAGVLDAQSLRSVVDSLWRSAQIEPGCRVKTLRGSLHGEVLRVLDDGRVVWRSAAGTELTALPESLVLDE